VTESRLPIPADAVHVAWRCSCGIRYEGPVHPTAMRGFRKAWETVHRGPGHHDLAEADRARHALLAQVEAYQLGMDGGFRR